MNVLLAALYVEADGAYFGIDNVDPWDEARDVRKYSGPNPVVAHDRVHTPAEFRDLLLGIAATAGN